uniref:Uncharacterized protein n=1 Tax=Anguilla anguilla TaxID=7936 RepID=A0A0E9VDM3_ANGAN
MNLQGGGDRIKLSHLLFAEISRRQAS